MALLIPALGHTRLVKPANGKTFTLEELQGLVGGYIEALAVPVTIHTHQGVVPADALMVLNEDGKRLALPFNQPATALMHGRLRPDDFIAGDAVICTRAEMGEGEE